LCPGAMLARESNICEQCLGRRVPWPAIRRACYRGSLGASATAVAMLSFHRATGTWKRRVQAYTVPSTFGRDKFVSQGFPADRIHVKPNFTADCGTGNGGGGYFLFVGRLSAEKGILALLQAYESASVPLPLKIVGVGPLDSKVVDVCSRVPGISWLGKLEPFEVRSLMKQARTVVCPSECYEMLPVTAVEAFSVGTPVIAPRLGAFTEVIRHGENGLLYEAFNTLQLNEALRFASDHATQMLAMRGAARSEFEHKYNADASYSCLMQIYESVRQVV